MTSYKPPQGPKLQTPPHTLNCTKPQRPRRPGRNIPMWEGCSSPCCYPPADLSCTMYWHPISNGLNNSNLEELTDSVAHGRASIFRQLMAHACLNRYQQRSIAALGTSRAISAFPVPWQTCSHEVQLLQHLSKRSMELAQEFKTLPAVFTGSSDGAHCGHSSISCEHLVSCLTSFTVQMLKSLPGFYSPVS